MKPKSSESEWKTRKKRIDPKLDAAGWKLHRGASRPSHGAFRTEEEETANGPADYALWLDGHIIGVVEAKKLTVGPQNVLTQAARYSRGIDSVVAPGNFDGHRAPFLYSTKGEVIWFHDVRHPLNRSRRVADLHTTEPLKEMLNLPQSSLSKAFAGELVPTEAELARAEGRTYETAEELLRRVAATSPVTKPRGTARTARSRRDG